MAGVKFGRAVAPHQRRAVAWYQPDVLWTAAREVLSSADQLRNRDLRESYQFPLTVIDRSRTADGGDFWFDFIADTGDGGNATSAVAHAALADSVPGESGEALLRGELLLLGGDLAYPGASPDEYRYRFIEMFEGSRRDAGPSKVRGRPFTLAALAQNHDWMDSASTFNRYFIRNKNAAPFLGATIPQQQSYFCVKLPNGWWALGFDFALSHDIDRDQYEQFEKLVVGTGLQNTIDGSTTTYKIAPTDRVVMIYPEPFWTRPIGDGAEPNRPKRYQRLEGLLRGRIAMRLAGDLHHYLRWESASDGMLVTCGTGGAFTHPTHTKATTRPILLRSFDNADAVPPEPGPAIVVGQDDGKQAGRSVAFNRIEASAYPDAPTSRRRATENILTFFKTNGSWRGGNWLFAALLGVLYWFNAYLNSLPFIDSFKPDGFQPMWAFAPSDYWGVLLLWLKAMIFSPLGFVINIVMVGGCMVMGRGAVDELSPRSSRLWRWFVTWGIGLAHALLHVLAVFSLEFWLQQAVGRLPVIGHPAHADAVAAIGHAVTVGVGMLVGGAVVGGLIFGCYLAFMSKLGYLTNNGYSALGIEDFKGFLRFRITPQGRLQAYFIGIDRVPRNWQTSPRGETPVWKPNDSSATAPAVRDSFSL
jgi:hypothetical protein